jgi:hypothetical protein
MQITVPPDVRIHVLYDNSGQPCDYWFAGEKGIPEPLKEKEMRISFCVDFIRRTLLADQSFGADMNAVLTSQELRGYFANGKPKSVVSVPRVAYDKLVTTMKNPSKPYHPITMGAISSFFSAVLDAKEGGDAAEVRPATSAKSKR